MRGRRTAVALLLVVALGGCGSSGDNTSQGLTSAQAQELVAQLEAARAAAAARNVAGTEAAIKRFRRSVARLRRAGAVTDASARAMRIGAARVLARVKSDNPPPAPASTQTTPAAAPPGQAKKEHKPGKGHGGEHGHGHGHEEGGD